MVDACSPYAKEHNLLVIFSTNVSVEPSKTKFLFFPYSQTSSVLDLYPVVINGLNLPYTSNGKHFR